MPHPLHATGVGWLTASVMLVVLSVVVFGGDLRRAAVAVTAVDDAVVGWLAGLDGPGVSATMEVLAAPASWMAITVLAVGPAAGAADHQAVASPARRRDRLDRCRDSSSSTCWARACVGRGRSGWMFRTDWFAWALPSEQMAALTVTLVGILYALVPEGRWRQVGQVDGGGGDGPGRASPACTSASDAPSM